jgi:predicted transposase/invertase (TIGR01784 family)
MNFLRYYIRFENPEMFAKFEEEIAILTERNTTMGIEEFLLDNAEKIGIERGIEKSVRDIALKMKKSGLDITLIANITGLSEDEIQRLA